MQHTVIGVFDNAQEARQAVEKLAGAGFSRSHIDLSAQTGQFTKDQPGTTIAEAKDDDDSIGSFFSSLFGDDKAGVDRYARVADRGSIVTVHAMTEDEAERAADMLDDNGAVDVNERAATLDNPGNTKTGTDKTVKVIEENLEVGKRTVETGGVRVRSRIVAKPVEESIRLREERVTLQRKPINRPATEADLAGFKEGDITMTERTEVPVVSKTASVVEEISVGKQVSEREEVIHDTVRKTEVNIDDTTGTKPKPSSDTDGLTYSTK